MRILISIIVLLSGLARAEPLSFSPLCSTGAVLQQAEEVALWGEGTPNLRVSISVGWMDAPIATTVDENGRWMVMVHTPKAGGPYEITATLDTGEQIVASDILIGEVWLCSGQSNMEMPLGPQSWMPRGTEGWEDTLNDADDQNLRLFTVSRQFSSVPMTTFAGEWDHADRGSVANFSAAAYYMGRRLREELDVPVGIVVSSWGGTRIQAWMSNDALNQVSAMKQEIKELNRILSAPGGIEAEIQNQHNAWLDALAKADPGSGLDGWWKEELDTSDWSRGAVPGGVDHIVQDFDGVSWYRRSFEAGEVFVGKELRMTLGAIDDMDRVWINGRHVAGLEGFNHWSTPRDYTIPAGIVRAGTNTIAIRVVDTFGPGGIWGDENGHILLAPVGSTRHAIRLDGQWFCRVGQPLNKIPPYPRGLDQHTPASIYNGMIAPITPMSFQGFAWYQGESNRADWHLYADCLTSMIDGWRTSFTGTDDAEFLIVQIAPFRYNGRDDSTSRVRQAQRVVAEANGNTLVVTTDIGDAYDVHPIKKKPVGDRLAKLALAKVYGRGLCASPPRPTTAQIAGSGITVAFEDTCGNLKTNDSQSVRGFTVVLADGSSNDVQATIKGHTVLIRTTDAVAVRYAWSEVPDVNLVNSEGLPASPFEIVVNFEE